MAFFDEMYGSDDALQNPRKVPQSSVYGPPTPPGYGATPPPNVDSSGVQAPVSPSMSVGTPQSPLDQMLSTYNEREKAYQDALQQGPQQFHPSIWRRLAGFGLGTAAGMAGGRSGYGRYSIYSSNPREAYDIAKGFTFGPQGKMNKDFERRTEALKGSASDAMTNYNLTRQQGMDDETMKRDALNRQNVQSEIAARERPSLQFDDNGKAFWVNPITKEVNPANITQGDMTQFPGGEGQLPQQLTKTPPGTLTDVYVPGEGNRKVLVNTRKGTTKDVGESKAPQATPANTDARLDRSYQFHTKEFDAVGKPIQDRMDRLNRLMVSIKANDPQADALIAPELLTAMAGGQGSGLRMNEAEIARIVGGRNQWQSIKSSLSKWQADPNKPFLILPEQREQINKLINTMGERVKGKADLLTQAQQRLADMTDPAQHKQLLAETKRRLALIDGIEDAVGKNAQGQILYRSGGKFILADGTEIPTNAPATKRQQK